MTTVAKSAQHPHSKLKTQNELKKITDSSSYKKADYKGKTEMLGGKTWTAQEMQTKINNKKPKRLRDRVWDAPRKIYTYPKKEKEAKEKKIGSRGFGRKSPYSVTDVRTQVIDALSGGRKGKPHSSPEGREASAGRKLENMLRSNRGYPAGTLSPKGGKRVKYAGGSGNRPRPHGPHMWVKTSGAVMSGKKVGIQIK